MSAAVKHQPGTPLPHVNESTELVAAGGVVAQFVVGQHAERDAAYYAHAGNAYPELIEYVRSVGGPSGAALLRKLGEAA